MRRLFLSDAAAGDAVEDVFVITNKQLSAASNGKPFIKAFLSDRSSQMPARMWSATREIFNAIPDGSFVRVRGRIENYQSNLQFIIDAIGAAKPGSFELADLIPHTDKHIPTMCKRVTELLQSIQNRHLAALVQAYLDDETLMANFCKAPAAQSFHHAFLGGLLEHTHNALEIGDCVSKFYPGLNRDLVLAGIFLHDIGKTWELSYDCAFGYTDGGQLVGHIVKSAMWVDEKRKAAEQALGESIPQNLINVLQHIILSHHGRLEEAFGSARNPCTPEAWMVHFIDEMDAKLMLALHLTRGESTNAEGNWTEFHKAFSGRLYRPDVAPAEVPVEALVEEAPSEKARDPRNIDAPPGEHPHMKLVVTNPLFETQRKG